MIVIANQMFPESGPEPDSESARMELSTMSATTCYNVGDYLRNHDPCCDMSTRQGIHCSSVTVLCCRHIVCIPTRFKICMLVRSVTECQSRSSGQQMGLQFKSIRDLMLFSAVQSKKCATRYTLHRIPATERTHSFSSRLLVMRGQNRRALTVGTAKPEAHDCRMLA